MRTVITTAIHKSGASPIFGEDTIHVSIDDYAGGPFIRIKNVNPAGGSVEPKDDFTCDLSELEEVTRVAQLMIVDFIKNDNSAEP